MGSMTRSKALLAVPATVLLGTVLGFALHTASAAGEEAEKPWGSEADCGACHLSQAASLQKGLQNDEEGPAEAKTGAGAVLRTGANPAANAERDASAKASRTSSDTTKRRQ